MHSKKSKMVLTLQLLLLLFSVASGALEYVPASQILSPTALDDYNTQLRDFNHRQAELAWNMSVDLEHAPEALARNERILVEKNLWNNEWCLQLLTMSDAHRHGHTPEFKSITEMRQVYLVCRGPRFSSYQVSKLLGILGTLRSGYDTTKICMNGSAGSCYRMEPDLNHVMETSRSEPQLREAWTKWHDTIGQALAKPYVDLVRLLNDGARQAGHSDIGACWREEMETDNLVQQSLSLYGDVRRLYSLLHAYVRYRLEKYYDYGAGLGRGGGRGPIPAHLLGNMWGQRWDSLLDIVAGDGDGSDGGSDAYIRQHIGSNATVLDMVHYAEAYYIRMGFPPLPASFYANSYFTSSGDSNETAGSGKSGSRNCHGSAANMFADPSLVREPDYRILMCARVQDSDLATIIHEMGHVHYFYAYSQLPTIFQDGANAAFQEAAGDSTTYGLYGHGQGRGVGGAPSIRDLLRLGLAKLPQIGFGLVVDLWRWKVFADDASGAESGDGGGGRVAVWNDLWWRLQYDFMGVARPDEVKPGHGSRGLGLDALGKYHVVDNIPYIRYFQASFLQHMFYASMCNNGYYDGSDTGGGAVYCDLEGRGHKLRQMMAQGSSKHWSLVLQEMTGHRQISARPLLEYFRPLQEWLEARVEELDLHVGW